MKICSKCKQEKDEKEFCKDDGAKDKLYSQCRDCTKLYREQNKDILKLKQQEYIRLHTNEKKIYDKAYYKRPDVKIHKHKYQKEYLPKRNKLYKQSIIKWHKIFKENGYSFCQKCGYNISLFALDFHHINPDDKRLKVGLFIATHSPNRQSNIDNILIEIQKCIVLCANCHRVLHHEQQ